MPGVVGHTTPPLSPREQHATPRSSKRKSGQHAAHGAKPPRPTTLSRRSTPQYITKLGAGRREKERECEAADDPGESFLNYCTYCEKQIDASSGSYLYCSESCRQRDLSAASGSSHHRYTPSGSSTYDAFSSSNALSHMSPPRTPYANFTFSPSDGPDIVPRASPTIPRPRSYFGSEPFPTSSTQGQYAISSSLPYVYPNGASGYVEGSNSNALASLRELSSALQSSRPHKTQPVSGREADRELDLMERNRRRQLGSGSQSRGENSRSGSDDESPVRACHGTPMSKSASGVWSYMPFASATSKGDISRTYSTPSIVQQQSGGYAQGGRSAAHTSRTGSRAGSGSGSAASSNYTLTTPLSSNDTFGLTRNPGMDRPLPPRSGGYGHRPKSIDLVTPFSAT
ncbi:MAG: hypothetical protein M1818_007174 [Claussenomyces sp. TS43310]|nr:MAG: hypothetical protein M1818_007174 [Claussenomyces sp. TS43310]